MSQRELAAVVGVHPITVSNWERGETTPDDPQMERLANYFETTPGALRYGSSDIPPIGQPLPRQMRDMIEELGAQLATRASNGRRNRVTCAR